MINTKTFIHDNFLLENKYAEELYHGYSKNQPIIDYHNHLPTKQIADDKVFGNITNVWINGDHYKWRAMCALGGEIQRGELPNEMEWIGKMV